MSLTGNEAIAAAFTYLNVFLPGEAPDANSGAFAFQQLNWMLGSWAQQRGTIPVVAREEFVTVAGQGGPSHPYTIGLGGDLNTDRPPNQASVTGAGLVLTSSSPAIEMPRALLTDDAWEAIQIKELTNNLFTSVYYNPTYALNLGTINLWPVPDVSSNLLVLYLQKAISLFANRTTTYYFPPGYDDAITTNLAVILSGPFGRTPDDILTQRARESLAVLKRVNLPISDLPQDLLVWTKNGYYNINTDAGGTN